MDHQIQIAHYGPFAMFDPQTLWQIKTTTYDHCSCIALKALNIIYCRHHLFKGRRSFMWNQLNCLLFSVVIIE